MSEVDSLSNSGFYPALPIADRPGARDEQRPRGEPRLKAQDTKAGDESGTGRDPRPPKSLIDEYA